MTLTTNARLVEHAEKNRRNQLNETVALDSAARYFRNFGPLARELHHVNKHITVDQKEIEDATNAYKEVAAHLVNELHWPVDAVKVLPQGSASTQTLIRSPDSSKFDIDAVCQVDISRVDAHDPITFFEKVGEALKDYEAIKKKRCWNLPYANERFYLEFTPSVPLATIPQSTLASMAPRFQQSVEYWTTALAVVDTPTRAWKNSNPEGFTKWVNTTAELQLIRVLVMDSASLKEHANITPVPDQNVEITDTLKVAIRLFKRHRDMCARRGIIDNDFKPISVIIVTLLTRCYAGLAELNRNYDHPVELLLDLAELLPGMVDIQNGYFHVDNPTVHGENFAERWNLDNGERYQAFVSWCDALHASLRTIQTARTDTDIKSAVQEAFGCGPSNSPTGGSGGPGLVPANRQPPSAPPKTQGLA